METTLPATLEGPRLTNAGTRPAVPRKLFVNVPVSDLQRSVSFFEALGFTFNSQFTDASAAAMLVGDDAYFMLLTRDKFASLARREVGEPWDQTTAMFALCVTSRAEVNEMVSTAVSAGGAFAAEAKDHDFMYGWSFYDPDGHHWEVFWMDPAVIHN